MLATFFSQPVVWSTSLVELLTLTSIVAFVAGAYRHIECHHSGCHRFGRFPHGHYKLCRVHHPQVPTTGQIDQAGIDEGAPTPHAEAPQAKPARAQPWATCRMSVAERAASRVRPSGRPRS